MRITPLDIRKQEFRKSMRGLDSDEVYAFLTTVADEYEAVLSDNKRLREHLVELEERLKEFRSMETNLRNTLMTAERVTAEAKENARREAGLIVREAEVEAEKAAESIRLHTQQLRREILELKKHKDNYITRLRTLLESHRGLINGFEDDFAEVDREIELIGKKVEEDSKAAVKGTRMSRDRITEEYQHKTRDKVTWDDEPRREDIPRPSVPRPGYQAEKSPEKKAAPPMKDSAPGRSGYDASEEPLQERIDFGSADAGHIAAADNYGPEFDDPRRSREVARRIEDSLYPEANVNVKPAMRNPVEPETQYGYQRPAGENMASNRQAPGYAPGAAPGRQAPRPEMQAQSPAAGTALFSGPDGRSQAPEQVQRDTWKDYDVKGPRTDWSRYEIRDAGAGRETAPEPGKVPNDSEVEAALSGLEEIGSQDNAGMRPRQGRPQREKVEPEILTHHEKKSPPQPQRGADQRPASQTPCPPAQEQGNMVQKEPRTESQGWNEDESGATWSMEELRKNLSNITRDQG